MTQDRRDFRLPADVRPSRYDIACDLDLEAWTFRGRERIEVHLDRPRREIELHSVDLDISRARAVRGDRGVDATASYDTLAETALLRFAAELPAGEHALELEWSGPIRDDLRGLYRSTRPGERYAATQLAAADARRMFPGFDEPTFKARFRLALTYPKDLVAVGNTPVERTADAGPGRVTTRFAETPPLSSYLLACAVGPFEATPEARTRSGVPVRVWLPRGLAESGLFMRDAHVRSLEYLEGYAGIPYPYGKVDAIGIPDFAAGAMENPGAITYRLRFLSTDPARTTAAVLKGAFGVAAHELTHMWWGDLVTLAWWDDIWLNESFATLVGNKAVATIHPEWRIWRDFVNDAAPAFFLDSLASTHPISGEVRNAAQASERFDAISYEKGAAVLRMLEGFLGSDTFRDGVRIYLRRHSEGNATAADFWHALDEASKLDVTRVASAWITEPGHPLLMCETLDAEGGLRVRLSQRRFFADPAAKSEQRWPIPVVLRYGTDRGTREARVLVEAGGGEVSLPGARWYFPNAQALGFYRFRLDDRAMKALLPAVRDLSSEERLALVDDAWALVRAGVTDAAQLVGVLRALGDEDDRAVLVRVSAILGSLSVGAVTDATRPAFARLARGIFEPAYARLGWRPRDGEDEDERERRRIAIDALGKYAEAADVRAEAARLARSYLDGAALDPDVATAVVNVGAIEGDLALHGRYLARMKEVAMRDPQAEARFRNALPEFTAPDAVAATLHAAFGGDIREQDMPFALMRLLGSRHGRVAAWTAVQREWDARIAPLESLLRQTVIRAISWLTPPELAQEAAGFLRRKRTPETAEVIDRALERLRVESQATARIARELETALR